MSVYLSVCLSICLSLSLSLSVCLSLSPSLSLCRFLISVHTRGSVFVSVYVCVCEREFVCVRQKCCTLYHFYLETSKQAQKRTFERGTSKPRTKFWKLHPAA